MKKSLITPLFAAATLSLVAACGGGEEPAASEAGNNAAAAAAEAEVPSQDEADATAADAINSENADAELDKLMKDIDG